MVTEFLEQVTALTAPAKRYQLHRSRHIATEFLPTGDYSDDPFKAMPNLIGRPDTSQPSFSTPVTAPTTPSNDIKPHSKRLRRQILFTNVISILNTLAVTINLRAIKRPSACRSFEEGIKSLCRWIPTWHPSTRILRIHTMALQYSTLHRIFECSHEASSISSNKRSQLV